MEWEDPPEDARRGAVSVEDVTKLTSRPGKWALWKVVRGHSPRKPKLPAGIEMHTRYVKCGGSRSTRIYLRYVGDAGKR